MKRLIVLTLCLVFSGMAHAAPENRNERFGSATAALEAGNYEEALKGYEALIAEGETAAALYYNMGLTLKAMGKPVDAALNFRRALVLDPRMLPARRALEEISETSNVPAAPFTWKEELSGIIPPRLGLLTGSIIFWAGLLLLQNRASREGRFGLAGFLAILLVLAGGALAVASYLADPFASNRRAALVTSPAAVSMHRTPSDNSPGVSLLPPGTNLQILDQSAGWTYAKTPDAAMGWIPRDKITQILPGTSLRDVSRE